MKHDRRSARRAKKNLVYYRRGVYIPGYEPKNWPKWIAITFLALTLVLLINSLTLHRRRETFSTNNTTFYNLNNNKNLQGPYRVARVVDGDTLDVNIDGKNERIRVIGMDTPETVDPRKTVQCFGIEADNEAKRILAGKMVYLEADSTQNNKDKYNRLLRYVYTDTTTNFSLVMIRGGFAHEYTYEIPYKYQSEFKNAEKEARENSRGLWSPTTCNGITK